MIVILLAPLLAFPPLTRPVVWIALLLPAMWVVCGAMGAALLPVTRLNGSLLLLLVAIGVSLVATFDIFFSAPKALGVVLGAAMFFAIVRRIDDGRSIGVAFDLYVLAGAGLALIGLLGTNWIGKVPLLAKLTMHLPAVIRGVPGQAEGFQPNAIAGALVLFIPVQLATVIIGDATWLRPVRVAALLFTTAVFVLTQSRNGWISLAIGIGAWALWQPRGARRARVAITIALLVCAAAALFVVARGFAVHEFGANVRSDVSGRMELWSRAIAMAEDFPLTGVGINGFRRVMPAMYPALLSPPDVDVAHAHNQLLTVVAEIGIPGLIAYLALWLGIAVVIAAIIRTTQNRQARWTAGSLGAAFLASFVFGSADVIPLGAKVGIAFWMAMALAVALQNLVAKEAAA